MRKVADQLHTINCSYISQLSTSVWNSSNRAFLIMSILIDFLRKDKGTNLIFLKYAKKKGCRWLDYSTCVNNFLSDIMSNQDL